MTNLTEEVRIGKSGIITPEDWNRIRGLQHRHGDGYEISLPSQELNKLLNGEGILRVIGWGEWSVHYCQQDNCRAIVAERVDPN